MSKLYKLNEFYSVTEMMLNKGTFLQNSNFLVFSSNFVQNQVTAPCNIRLEGTCQKIAAVFLFFSFLILMTLQRSVTEMVLIVGKIFQTQIVKKKKVSTSLQVPFF